MRSSKFQAFLVVPQDVITVGSAPSADLRIQSANVAAEHARVERRGGRTYVLALQGKEEDLQSKTGKCLATAI